MNNNVFNPAPPTVMHVDLNSCFASIEQQANPLLRGKPVVVAAYTSPGGCILAASREAKQLGIKTGFRVAEAQGLYPKVIVLPPDPDKYRFVNRKLLFLFQSHTDCVEVKSIDEMVLQFAGTPALQTYMLHSSDVVSAMYAIGKDIKNRIRREVGDWLTVSIGIAPNRFLAKTASNLHKPDGLDVITRQNVERILATLPVTSLCGIKKGYGSRLAKAGITNALALYQTSLQTLQRVFSSIVGRYWWLWLHGWETLMNDANSDAQKTFGQSYALYIPYTPVDTGLHQVLYQLSEKVSRRMRADGYEAKGLGAACLYRDYTFWHKDRRFSMPLYATRDIYDTYRTLLMLATHKPVRILFVRLFALVHDLYAQESFDAQMVKKAHLTKAIDAICNRWGSHAITSARTLGMPGKILDRISFGNIRGLDDFSILTDKI